jgi:Uri superfamily endonuclease
MTEMQVPELLVKALTEAGLCGPLMARTAPDGLPAESGAYLLLLGLGDEVEIARAGIREILPPGWYLYAGSAYGPGGIAARVARHFRRDKPRHWHIDALTGAAALHALSFPGGRECDLVARLRAQPDFRAPVPGFGSSDCRTCESHLLAWRQDARQGRSLG